MPRQATEEIDFGIHIDFVRESPDPARVFRSMSSLIESLQSLDRELVKMIDVSIEPVLMLEDIESGSLRTWLREVISSLDDQALKEGDWKRVIGSYVVRAKYIVIHFLDGRKAISERRDIEILQGELVRAAEETEVRKIPAYSPIPMRRLLGGIQEVNDSLRQLNPQDKAKFISSKGDADFNLGLEFSLSTVEDLLTREVIVNDNAMILKVKKPDYLGESMWEFRFEGRPIDAKILDLEWLRKFQGRSIDVRPGDALRATVRSEVGYGFDGEVTSTKYTILRVMEIIRYNPPIQGDLQ